MSRTPFLDPDDYHAWLRITTRGHACDAYGHVTHEVYNGWFVTAVNQWLMSTGLLTQGGDPVGLVVDSECSHAYPIAFPQS